MDYKKIHDLIIERAKHRVLTGYKERHHIVPRCLGGNNTKDNLVDLTAREHFIIHKLLCEINPGNNKLHYALWRMMNLQNKHHIRNYNISSYEYEMRKQIQQERARELGLSNKGKKHSQETIEKRTTSLRGIQHSPETIEKYKKRPQSTKGVSRSTPWMIGKQHSIETRQKMSDSKKGRIISDETKLKISEGVKRYKNSLK
jgi:hypothetical protein